MNGIVSAGNGSLRLYICMCTYYHLGGGGGTQLVSRGPTFKPKC